MSTKSDDFMYKLRKINPVSSKIDPICSNNIYLSLNKPTTFGRVQSDEVQIRLLSKTTPLMISRKHATISVDHHRSGSVSVSDHDSINGVYVQNKRIKPGVPAQLKVGDVIAFGCGVGNNSPEFEYVLEVNKVTHKRLENSNRIENFSGSPSKRTRVDSPVITIIESNAAQIKEQEEKIKKLTHELECKEALQSQLSNEYEEKEKGLVEKLEKQKQDLELERSEEEQKLKELLQKQLAEKEMALRTEFDEQIQLLQSEKDLVEKNLQEELSKKLSEKDQAYELVLEQQRDMLEKAMFSKENEKGMLIAELQVKENLIEKYKCVEENQKQLEDCLLELRKEIQEKESQLQKQKEFVKKVEDDAKQTVIQTMEDEFTCIICQELFIDATTLPCAHSFCEICLRLWMKKKKSCPVCRRRIKDKAVKSVVLDSAVERILESMDDETKKRRTEIIKERAEQKLKEDSTEDPDGVRQMILRPEDADNDETEPARNDRSQDNRNTNRRDGYRRRSRSRSPRYHNHRHRPYYDNRHNQNNGNNSNNNYNAHHLHQSGFHHQNYAPFLHQMGSSSRYYQQERSNHAYMSGNFHNNYAMNNQRCFNCGGVDHLARFCPRR